MLRDKPILTHARASELLREALRDLDRARECDRFSLEMRVYSLRQMVQNCLRAEREAVEERDRKSLPLFAKKAKPIPGVMTVQVI